MSNQCCLCDRQATDEPVLINQLIGFKPIEAFLCQYHRNILNGKILPDTNQILCCGTPLDENNYCRVCGDKY